MFMPQAVVLKLQITTIPLLINKQMELHHRIVGSCYVMDVRSYLKKWLVYYIQIYVEQMMDPSK